jgi:hypothetical protein
MARLVNRLDVWGSYVPEKDRGKVCKRSDGTEYKLGATLTKPSKDKRGQVLLTEGVILRHFRPRHAGDVIGLHTTSEQNNSRWGGLDIDRHGEGSADPAKNLAAAVAWYVRLRELGFRPLLTDSNGRGGYHLDVLFRGPAPTALVYGFLAWLARDFADFGLSGAPEQFPKQPYIPPGKYGNWKRLLGRHHTRDHWSRVWDGERWLEGDAAIECVLSLRGDPASLIPTEAVRLEHRPATPRRATACGRRADSGSDLSRRIANYMGRLENRSEGGRRDDFAYRGACYLVRDMQLSDDEALEWLDQWDQRNCPPKGRDRLREIIRSAHAYGQYDYGRGRQFTQARSHGHDTIRFAVRI